jgi:hypothetical protein
VAVLLLVQVLHLEQLTHNQVDRAQAVKVPMVALLEQDLISQVLHNKVIQAAQDINGHQHHIILVVAVAVPAALVEQLHLGPQGAKLVTVVLDLLGHLQAVLTQAVVVVAPVKDLHFEVWADLGAVQTVDLVPREQEFQVPQD